MKQIKAAIIKLTETTMARKTAYVRASMAAKLGLSDWVFKVLDEAANANQQRIDMVVVAPGEMEAGLPPLHEDVTLVLHGGGWDNETIADVEIELIELVEANLGGRVYNSEEYYTKQKTLDAQTTRK